MTKPGGSVIFVVDDNPDIRETLTDVLGWEGYRVMPAANGREALDHLRDDDTPPAVILLDVMMPVMNGIQFRVEQCAHAPWRDIPTVVMTAMSVEQLNEMGMAMDGAHYLRKPVDIDELLRVVARFCAPQVDSAVKVVVV